MAACTTWRKGVFTSGPLRPGNTGWSVSSTNGRQVINHAGGINGFVTLIARYPEQKLFLAVLSNNTSVLVRDVARAQAYFRRLNLPATK